MKLQAKARPVRIRIESGEKEHNSLESLKENFVPEDILPLLDGRLKRWLRQLHENDLADAVGKIGPKSGDAVLELYKCLYGKKKTPYEYLEFLKSEYTNSAKSFLKYLLQKETCKENIKQLFKNNRDVLTYKEWSIFLEPYCNEEEELAEFMLYYYKDNAMLKEGKELYELCKDKFHFTDEIKEYFGERWLFRDYTDEKLKEIASTREAWKIWGDKFFKSKDEKEKEIGRFMKNCYTLWNTTHNYAKIHRIPLIMYMLHINDTNNSPHFKNDYTFLSDEFKLVQAALISGFYYQPIKKSGFTEIPDAHPLMKELPRSFTTDAAENYIKRIIEYVLLKKQFKDV